MADHPDKYLLEHVLKGDSGDGVPNILSPDNSLAIGERQKAMTAKRMEELIKGPEHMDEITRARYFRNKMMIDLSQVPENYKEQILKAYAEEKAVGRSALFNYFVSKKLKHLLTDIQALS